MLRARNSLRLDAIGRLRPRFVVLVGLVGSLGLIAGHGCEGDAVTPYGRFIPADLAPTPNRFTSEHWLYEPQPPRDHPNALALTPDGRTLLIGLTGSVDNPGRAVLALNTSSFELVGRYEVGSGPSSIAVHPGGRFAVVTNQFSNHLSFIDLRSGEVAAEPADFYTVGAAFAPSGNRLYLTNRWRDTLQVWDVTATDRLEVVGVATNQPSGIPVGTNPRELLVSDDGARVYVAAHSGLTVSVINAQTLTEVDIDDDAETTDFGAPESVTRRHIGAPPNGLALVDDHLYVATLSASTHHPALAGPDTNHDGIPGDGTPNMGFQDLQNELAIYGAESLAPVERYTSDTICCFDFRDVSPDDPELGEMLPDSSLWIVGGALPEQVRSFELDGAPHLLVVYSGSNQAQRFEVQPDGLLMPGPIVDTGLFPGDVVIDPQSARAYIANRLGESLTVVDLRAFEVVQTMTVGDVSRGAFPATDAELGELYYFAGAAFSIDGDQVCNHCHHDRSNVAKAFSMPLLADSRGSRMTPASRGMFDTRPWFFEGAMDENNFFPVINEFARAENFCCADYVEDEDCALNPPPECSERPWPHSLPTRDQFFVETADELLGYRRSIGTVIESRIDYLGMTRLLGLFLLHEPGLLPNPNPPNTPNVARGRQIFNSASTACSVCHPQPAFSVSTESSNPFDAPLHFGPVISPTRDPDGTNLDLAHAGFLQTFPMARQGDADIRLNAPTLVGLWDRAEMFLHDGRARNLREALCTPGHPALRPGEIGYNELDGVFDAHGGTSHLTEGDIADLIEFLLTL